MSRLKLNRKYKYGLLKTKAYKEGVVISIEDNNCVLEITKGHGWIGNPNSPRQLSTKEYWNVHIMDDYWIELPIKNIVGGKLI